MFSASFQSLNVLCSSFRIRSSVLPGQGFSSQLWNFLLFSALSLLPLIKCSELALQQHIAMFLSSPGFLENVDTEDSLFHHFPSLFQSSDSAALQNDQLSMLTKSRGMHTFLMTYTYTYIHFLLLGSYLCGAIK